MEKKSDVAVGILGEAIWHSKEYPLLIWPRNENRKQSGFGYASEHVYIIVRSTARECFMSLYLSSF